MYKYIVIHERTDAFWNILSYYFSFVDIITNIWIVGSIATTLLLSQSFTTNTLVVVFATNCSRGWPDWWCKWKDSFRWNWPRVQISSVLSKCPQDISSLQTLRALLHYELQLGTRVVEVMNLFIDETYADTVPCSQSLIDLSDHWPKVM